MKLGKVLFIGGSPKKFPSVQIRCGDIASRLGCDCVYSVKKAEELPPGYSAFICVKPRLGQEELIKLAKRGLVIWDIVDKSPPENGVSIYLASTKRAKQTFEHLGRIEVIPHHHCNFDNIPNPQQLRRPGWIGTLRWLPHIEGFDHDVYNVNQMTSVDVARAHRHIGIGLNLRAETFNTALHAEINTGIKLINCIGFGIPSISSDEPAYREIGGDCTIFTDLRGSAQWVHELQNNDQIYLTIRNNCLIKASAFHISSILEMYKTLLALL
jgi:hypothetical protein